MLNYLSASTVLSIDLGADFVKVFYVAPGSSSDPFPILLDRSSARKFPNLISYLREEIQIGVKAHNTLINKAEYAYPWIFSNILGRHVNEPEVKQWQSLFANPTKSKDDHILIKMEKSWINPELLMALLLKEIKENAESSLEKAVHGALITIPANFGPRQKMALRQAAEIAGLPLLGFVKSTEAAAIQYMLGKSSEGKETVLFLDSGASSTTAVLAEIGKGSVEIKSTITDSSISGHAIDLALMDRLMSQHRLKLKSQEWYRLLAEVQKSKKIISISGASKNLNIDLTNGKGILTFQLALDDIQAVCQPLLTRFDALVQERQNITIAPIGSTMRFPMFMKHLENFNCNLNHGLNNEEAAARGGAYLATKLYGRFKIKDFQFKSSDSFDWMIENSEIQEDRTFAVKGPNLLVKSNLFGPFMNVNIKDDLPPTFSSNITLSIDAFGMPFVKRIQAKFIENEQEKNKYLQSESITLLKGFVSDAAIKDYKKWIEDYDRKVSEKIELSNVRNELESKMFDIDPRLEDKEYTKWMTQEEISQFSGFKAQIENYLSKNLALDENKKLLKSIQTLENECLLRKSKRQDWQKILEELSKLSLSDDQKQEESLVEIYDKLSSKKDKISATLAQTPINHTIELGFSLKDAKDLKSELQKKQIEIMVKKQIDEMKKKQEEEAAFKKNSTINSNEEQAMKKDENPLSNDQISFPSQSQQQQNEEDKEGNLKGNKEKIEGNQEVETHEKDETLEKDKTDL